MIESELQSIRIFLVKSTLEIAQNKDSSLVLLWQLILRLAKLKIEKEKKW